MTDFICPEAEYHGKPFRYCPVKGCGWMEETPPAPPNPEDTLNRVRAAVWTLYAIVPSFWWSTPPNQATADVLQGIKGLEDALGLPGDWHEAAWRDGANPEVQNGDDQ